MSYLDLDLPFPRLSLMAVNCFDRPFPRLRMVIDRFDRPFPRLKVIADMLSSSPRQNTVTRPTTVSFNVIQIVTGISLEQFTASSEFDSVSLQEGIADSMTGVLSSDITSFHVTGPIFPSSKAVPDTNTRSIILLYKVDVSSYTTADELMNQLAAAFSDGPFDVCLHDGTFDVSLEQCIIAPKTLPRSPQSCPKSQTNPLLLPPPVPLRAHYLQAVQIQCVAGIAHYSP